MKLKPLTDTGRLIGYVFFCPGCEHVHVFYVSGQVTWSFTGDEEQPTFSPSLLNTSPDHPDPKQRRCHLNLTFGKLQFHPDCSHALAGKLVDLPEWPWEGGP